MRYVVILAVILAVVSCVSLTVGTGGSAMETTPGIQWKRGDVDILNRRNKDDDLLKKDKDDASRP